MDRAAFAGAVQRAVIAALGDFRRAVPGETPYAFALVPDQGGDRLMYAIATEEGLRRVAAEFTARGYRFRGHDGAEADPERLAAWLRWAHPEDGWSYGDFPGEGEVARLVTTPAPEESCDSRAEELEEACTAALAGLPGLLGWRDLVAAPVIVGVLSGDDPRDFLRTATRANEFRAVRRLWAEHWQADEASRFVVAPGARVD